MSTWKTPHYGLLLVVFASLYANLGLSQGLIPDIITHYCEYEGPKISNEIYFLPASSTTEEIIREICQAAGLPIDFEIRQATINSVAAVRYQEKYYLLYNDYFCTQLQKSRPALLYAILGHEIGHIAQKHSLGPTFRVSQESEADQWLGRLLYKMEGISSIRQLIIDLEKQPFNHQALFPNHYRQKVIQGGYNSEDGLARSHGNLGFFEDKANIDRSALPVFELKGCPQFLDLPKNYFSKATNLQQVDQQLTGALRQMGYQQRRYYAVPNGFAMITPVEQITKEGKALGGTERWQDYPSTGAFQGILDYLKSVVVPRPGYFRLFAFVVTNQNMANNGGQVNKEMAREWLKKGGHWLPASLGQQEFTSLHHTAIFLFEFQAGQATKQLEEKCNPNLLSIEMHLQRSGLLQALKIQANYDHVGKDRKN